MLSANKLNKYQYVLLLLAEQTTKIVNLDRQILIKNATIQIVDKNWESKQLKHLCSVHEIKKRCLPSRFLLKN